MEMAMSGEPGLATLPAEDAPNFLTPVADRTRATWLHVIAHLDPKYGGVSAVVPQLDAAIAGTGCYSIDLTAFCNRGEEHAPPAAAHVQVNHLPLARGDWKRQPNAAADFERAVEGASGVHIHGLWQRSTALSASLSRKAGKPYVVSAHGMLERWALANKKWKKQIYLALVERKTLEGAACLHALTKAEVADYRRLGLRNPIAVIPNGVQLPAPQSPDAFLASFPQFRAKRLILFLGRIHFKKGLDILCRAWAKTAADYPDAHLVLAGPDFEGTRARVERMLQELGLTDRVTFTGMLSGDVKWSALAASEFFVLPSYSEGLSVSVLEAMGMAKPVLITENCNLPEVRTYAAGTVIQATEDELYAGLQDMLRLSGAALSEMGSRGAHLVRTQYSWAAIGKQMASLYGWLEGGAKPDDVEIDTLGARL